MILGDKPLILEVVLSQSLFSSYSEVDHMIDHLLFYDTCLDLSVNCKYLVLVWIWSFVYMSYVPLVGLVKLILYHVNLVTATAALVTKKNTQF
jgi:hypothetical protein